VTTNPDLVGPRTPTPPVVYEPRIWSGRIWTKGCGIAGIGFTIKAPYGIAVNMAEVLTRACARGQIARFTFGPTSKAGFKRLDRSTLKRYEDVLADLSARYSIDWAA
jgi:hypothetical protein